MPGGGGGYSHNILAIRVRTAEEVMVFKPFGRDRSQKTEIKIN